MDLFDNNPFDECDNKINNSEVTNIGGLSDKEINEIDIETRRKIAKPNTLIDNIISIYYGV